MGPGSNDFLTTQALDLLRKAELVIGSQRLLDNELIKPNTKRVVAISAESIMKALEENDSILTLVLFSGDTGSFSGFKSFFEKAHTFFDIVQLPGISSVSYFSSKVQIPWTDWQIVSAHGKSLDLSFEIKRAQSAEKNALFLLLDHENSAQALIEKLRDLSVNDCKIIVGERLSYEDEKISRGTAKSLSSQDFDPLSVMLILFKETR